MRLWPPRKAHPLEGVGSLVASAQRITSERLKTSNGQAVALHAAWQDDAWDMYDLVGEQRFLSNTLANRLAQANLFVGRVEGDGTDEPKPVEDQEVAAVLDPIGHTSSGLSQIIQRLGVNLFVAGDAWLVGVPQVLMPAGERTIEVDEVDGIDPLASGDDITDLEWRALSVAEVSTTSTGLLTLSFGPRKEDQITVNPEDVWLLRVWRPHPRRAWEADSPTRSVLPVLRELVQLTKHISAQADSRLAGAGLLEVPYSVTQAIKTRRGTLADEDDDPFTDALIEAMITPIEDRASAAALVPLVVTVPDEAAGKIKHHSFAVELDDEARELRDEAIRRLALGQDAPPELLLGVDSMNHWGAWLVREDVVSSHLEPPLALICDAITTGYLWPVLRAMGMPEVEVRQHVVWYDVSHMIVRPNRAKDARELYAAGVLTDQAVREANGFDEGDAPDTEDRDPIDLAFELVARAPSLAQDPGIPALAESIRQAIEGAPVPTTGLPTPGGAAPADGAPEDIGEPTLASQNGRGA